MPASRFLARAALALILAVSTAAPALLRAAPAAAAETRAFVTTTDYTSGGLRRIALDTRAVLPGEAAVYSDTRLRWHDGLIYVINRFGQDNLQVVDPATLATIHQFSTGNGSNPADVAFAGGKAYVTRYEMASLLVMDPATGATLGTISLAPFADADGIPEMDRMMRVGPWLFVSCQRLDRAHGFVPTDTSLVVVVDTRADTVLDVNPLAPGKQAIVLTGRNPVTPFALDPASGRLLIGCVGRYGVLDGGIEWLDPTAMTSLGFAITEAALGGDIAALAWNGAAHSYAIVSDASYNTSLVSWSALSGAKLATVYAPGGFSLSDAELDDRGELYVANGSFTSPGVLVFRAGADTLLAGPLDVGLAPGQIAFDRDGADVAAVPPGEPRLGLLPPRPNPARSEVRLTLALARTEEIELAVFDVAGRRVRSVARGRYGAGRYDFTWNLSSDGGIPVPSGVYMVRGSAGAERISRRVAVVR